ncbi:hydroxysqualene dehydroxylase HpnE [Isosphaeraceae bacterium EP7]
MLTNSPRPRILIVGGGLAGLASAVSLANRGLDITLVESRPRLGGRASSFVDPATGELVDNCQHVSMTCCTNLADFCRRVGTADLFKLVPEITFVGHDGALSRLSSGPLPAPIHLSGSFLRTRYLRIDDKLRVGYGLARLALDRSTPADTSFADWLLDHGQTTRTINLYWATVLVSALNERLEQMDFGHARKVFVDGFLRNRDGYQVEIPTVPLGDLYGTRLESWLADNRVQVRLKTGIRSIDADPAGPIQGVTLRSGETIAADRIILAVPFDRILGLLDDPLRGRLPSLDGVDRLESSPITGIHLWFDHGVFPLNHATLPGGLVHWVFNHSSDRQDEAEGQYLQLVISASYDLVPLSNDAILDLALADLSVHWPGIRREGLRRWRVVTEHGATFAVRPGVDSFRPDQRTEVAGLYLAGDWTRTGWPATMEGAVRSGYLAAEAVLTDLGTPEHLVRPDLPASWLSRLLIPGLTPNSPAAPGPGSARGPTGRATNDP